MVPEICLDIQVLWVISMFPEQTMLTNQGFSIFLTILLVAARWNESLYFTPENSYLCLLFIFFHRARSLSMLLIFPKSDSFGPLIFSYCPILILFLSAFYDFQMHVA